MATAFKKFIPLFDRVLVQRFAAETKTKGGVLIPEKAQSKVQSGTVIAVGPGFRTDEGKVVPNDVKVGDQVLLPEFGGTKIVLEDQDYFLFREGDFLGKFQS
ncbi:10 kDa heat shock protein, mitochondrial [Lamellibrachia satsuma]|nr:10 kDa heat shock protein, mitochondrial [Lamellibrachia satsuma]